MSKGGHLWRWLAVASLLIPGALIFVVVDYVLAQSLWWALVIVTVIAFWIWGVSKALGGGENEKEG